MAILEAYGDKIVGGTADPTEITWTAWNALSTAEQEALGQVMITDVPGAIGTIQSNIIKLLWTNPNPTSELAPGAVTASENARNFDLLLVEWKRSTAAGLVSYTIVRAKGSGGRIHDTRVVNDEATITQRYRDVGTLSDGRISFGGGQIITPGSPGTTAPDRTVVIVTAVYGIKTTIDLNFSAIAQDVSTSANKCMMSDGVTSVEDTLTATDFFSDIITVSGVTLRQGYAKIINGVKYIYLRFESSSGITSRTMIGLLPTKGRPSLVIRMTSSCASIYDYPLNMVANAFIAPDGSIYAGDYISPSDTAIKEVNIIASYI